MKFVEDFNTLVFVVDHRATKKQINRAFSKMYNEKVERVRTLIRPTGDKKAFIKLPSSSEASDVANRIGIC